MQSCIASAFPEEACGLLGGSIIEPTHFLAQKIYPIENSLHSQERYKMDPMQQLRAFEEIDKHGLALVAIYHSHAKGPLYPSLTDITECLYPEVIQLIWARPQGTWKCGGFLLQPGMPLQVAIEVVDLRGKIKKSR